MQRTLTLFKNIFDKKVHRKVTFESWNNLADALIQMSDKPGLKPTKEDPFNSGGSPLFTPAVFRPGSTRANSNVLYWGGWIALDIDAFDGTLDEATSKFDQWSYVCYNSASSTEDKPKFRMVIPTTREIEADEIPHFWWSINTHIGHLADAQTKDICRMFYVPAKYPDAYDFCWKHEGEMLDPDEIMKLHPWIKPKTNFLDSLPQAYRDALLASKQDNLKNTNFSWTCLDDCPFVYKRAVTEYMAISETGWYHKMYCFMCSIASAAIKRGYPITPSEVSSLCKELDDRTGSWYAKRNFEVEATRAIQHVLKSAI